MTHLALRSRALANGSLVHVNESGGFLGSGLDFARRLALGKLDRRDLVQLQEFGHAIADGDELALHHHDFRVAQRLTKAGPLDYLILVPTLRCNLSCSYCQVSRVAASAKGFDWDEATLNNVLALLDDLTSPSIKIEFQGGEPTLRPDLVARVIERCERFEQKQFVICTNLHHLDDKIWQLFDRPDLYISTSLDGTMAAHAKQRTLAETPLFERNLRAVIDRYGPTKLSALPTIDPTDPPDPDKIIDTFNQYGLTSIFLRPINFQGFARKRHAHSQKVDAAWNLYHRKFLHALIERNWNDKSQVFEETYFSICLRRIFTPQQDRHVDLRNPNPMGVDYVVIDYDGKIYPTDEARMLSRSRVVDLCLGQVGENWRGETWRMLNDNSTNQFDPDCQRCAYQPYCGRDIVDDLARYGTLDIERTKTAFCKRHMAIFDLVFELLFDPSPAVRYSLSRWLRLDGESSSFGPEIS